MKKEVANQTRPKLDEANRASSCHHANVEFAGRTESATRMKTAGKMRRMQIIAQNGGNAKNRMNRGYTVI